MRNINIAGRLIGEGQPPYIIAELSANHNGNIEVAFETIAMAKDRGADAIKIQTYTPDTLTIDCDNPDFLISGGLWEGRTLYELYDQAHTPFEWHPRLFEYARKIGITIFSTPFDESAVDLLEDLNAPAYKIASFELIDHPLVAYVAATKKPMIMSTGMATETEISEALEVARSAGCNDIVLLHCISSYPAPLDESNLRAIATLGNKFDIIPGLSDHTLGTIAATTSVALGAKVIEKHVILDRKMGGPDSSFSLEPDELEALCDACSQASAALGDGKIDIEPSEKDSLVFRRSLYAVADIEKGEMFSTANVKRIRPGFGLAPKHRDQVIGKRAAVKLGRGTALQWDHIE